MYELIAYSTDRSSEDIRYRIYTVSETKAKLFEQIPKIQFSDSGHGIVFCSRECVKKRENIYVLRDYVDKHMELLMFEQKPVKRFSKKEIHILDLERKLMILQQIIDRYKKEHQGGCNMRRLIKELEEIK